MNIVKIIKTNASRGIDLEVFDDGEIRLDSDVISPNGVDNNMLHFCFSIDDDKSLS